MTWDTSETWANARQKESHRSPQTVSAIDDDKVKKKEEEEKSTQEQPR